MTVILAIYLCKYHEKVIYWFEGCIEPQNGSFQSKHVTCVNIREIFGFNYGKNCFILMANFSSTDFLHQNINNCLNYECQKKERILFMYTVPR